MFIFLSLIHSEEGKTKFEKIYNEYHAFMFMVAKCITENHYDAEEALQDALFIVAQNIDKIETDDKNRLKSFLKSVVRNCSIDFLRRKSRKEFLSIESFDIADNRSIEDIEEKDAHDRIVEKIIALPGIYRDVLTLNVINGLPPRIISDILSISIHTANTRLRRGKKILAEIIDEELGNEK